MLKKLWRKNIASVLAGVLLAVSMPFTAQAVGEALDTSRKGSVTVTLTAQKTGKPVAGGKMTIYQIADLQKDENKGYYYSMVGAFAESGVQIQPTGQDQAAEALAVYASQQNLTGETQSVDNSGTVKFSDLELGIYLLVQTENASGWYPVSSFLVSVPMQVNGDGNWVYDLNASPKVEAKPKNGGSSHGGSSNGSSSGPGGSTPAAVVEISDGPIPLDTIMTDIVDETVPLALLPQTGQLNWPVPVMAIAGLLLFAGGWCLAFSGAKRHG